MHKIKAVILDWAGTTIDYGCFAPVKAFITAFEAFGLKPTMEETRAPMGLQKKAHIAKMLEGERLSALWQEQKGSFYTQEDIDAIYDKFEPALFEVLQNYTDLLPGAIEAVNRLRDQGIVIGSTTGYTEAMMDVVVPIVKSKGYEPDCLVCPDEIGGIGRPYPYMLWRNLEKLGILSISEVVKVGDTEADMEEGKNAGCLCVGILKGSSLLGLTEAELSLCSDVELDNSLEAARKNYINAGADYVINEISELPGLITSINESFSM